VKDRPLGFANSRLYDRGGHTYYQISPILGTRINLPLHGAVSEIEVLGHSDCELVLRKGVARYTFTFNPVVNGLEKLRLSIRLFRYIPIGVCFGNISTADKQTLLDAFSCV